MSGSTRDEASADFVPAERNTFDAGITTCTVPTACITTVTAVRTNEKTNCWNTLVGSSLRIFLRYQRLLQVEHRLLTDAKQSLGQDLG